MKKIRGQFKKVTYGHFFAFATLFLLLTAIFITINNALQKQALHTKAASDAAVLPPGSVGPSEAQCSEQVVKTPENIPDNQTANNTNLALQNVKLTGSKLGTYGAPYEQRVTGNFSGTTDEILQWGACKWGFDADTARGMAAGLSKWKQSALADCNNQGQIQPETNGCQSVGLMRVKAANIPPSHPGMWPYAKTSTAFNVDYALGFLRACYDGKTTDIGQGNAPYAAGDLNGCIGAWYSGAWHDGSAEGFILGVENIIQTKEWTTYTGGSSPIQSTTAPNTTTPGTNPTAVVSNPTFGVIAPCPSCANPTITPMAGITTQPIGGTNAPSGSVINPLPTEPCSADASIASDNKHKNKHKKHKGGISNFMEEILKFFMQLILLLIQILGGGQVSEPSPLPTPTGPEPSSDSPIPCPPSETPSAAPQTTTGVSQGVPSVVPSSPVISSAVPSQAAGESGDPTAATCGGSANTPASPVPGYKLTQCEDFNGTTTGAFKGYEGGGEGTVVGGGRKASQCTAGGGMLTLTQTADGSTCGGDMSSFGQKYGYWEVRMKTSSTGTGGSAPHPVLILWPDTDRVDGELDFFETDLGESGSQVFLHCVGNPSQNCYNTKLDVDYTQWHVYGFEWTAAGFTGYIDGKQIYTTDGKGSNPSVNMHQTIQLDNLTGKTPVSPGKMEVDWVHMYSK